MLERRRFLAGLTGLICAPAIVRAASIMPVRGWVDDGVFLVSMAHPENPDVLVERFIYNTETIEIALGYAITRKAIDRNLYMAEFKPSAFREERFGRLIEWKPENA